MPIPYISILLLPFQRKAQLHGEQTDRMTASSSFMILLYESLTIGLSDCRPIMYRGANKGLYVLLSRTQAEPGRTVKQEQEEISRNHVQTFIYLSVFVCEDWWQYIHPRLSTLHLRDHFYSSLNPPTRPSVCLTGRRQLAQDKNAEKSVLLTCVSLDINELCRGRVILRRYSTLAQGLRPEIIDELWLNCAAQLTEKNDASALT